MVARSKRGVGTLERYWFGAKAWGFTRQTRPIHPRARSRPYHFLIGAPQQDWVNTIRYFHGKEPVRRQGQVGLRFRALMVILGLITLFALLAELG